MPYCIARRHDDFMQTISIPQHRYTADSDSIQILHPSASRIDHQNRAGIHFSSTRGRAALPNHTPGSTHGSVVLWVLPLQDFFPAAHHPAHAKSNPFFDRFVFLSDREAVQEIEAASFSLMYCSYWHPVYVAKFSQGTVSDAMFHDRTAIATSGHFELHALNWYQLVVTWNHDTSVYVLYANGIKVGHSDVTKTSPKHHDPPAPWLYFGNPTYAMGDVAFYSEAFDQPQIAELFEREAAGATNPTVQASLQKTYQGRGLPKLDWRPDGQQGWKPELSLPLTRPEDYAHFFNQGSASSVHFTPDGFRITTPPLEQYVQKKGKSKTLTGDELDMTRMYLWTRRMFQGDLFVTFEFSIHNHGGLALLMTQAAGMQAEDFLADYPLRSDGSMSVVCWEDVRNYHWEFYREMVDTRNDLVSHAALKNPWFRPLSFQIENRTWDLDRWYRLTYLQEGSRIRGAIDDVTVMDATDTGFDNNGPVLHHGHIALRCMMRTDVTFRNLEVWTKPDFQQAPLRQI
jgi:hypothetical protein